MLEINKIHLGDSYELIKQIPDKSVDLVIIDPPYEIESVTGGGMLEEKRLVDSMQHLQDKGLDIGISYDVFDDILRVLKKPNIYIWCNKKMIPNLLNYFVTERDCSFEIISWHKTNALPLCGGKYLTDTEYCLYFKDGIKLNTIYETAKTHYELQINMDDKTHFDHPTIKPLPIIKNLIINSSNEGDLVLDCFSGSGTTCVAAKELNRRFIGIEIDPHYHKISVDRLNGICANGQTSIFTDFGEVVAKNVDVQKAFEREI